MRFFEGNIYINDLALKGIAVCWWELLLPEITGILMFILCVFVNIIWPIPSVRSSFIYKTYLNLPNMQFCMFYVYPDTKYIWTIWDLYSSKGQKYAYCCKNNATNINEEKLVQPSNHFRKLTCIASSVGHFQFPEIVQGLVQCILRLAGCRLLLSHEQDDDVDEQQADEDEGEVDDEIL